MKPAVSGRYQATLDRVVGPKVLDIGLAGQQDFQPQLKSLIGILDSPGWLHGTLRRAGFDVSGIDIDQKTIDYLKSQGLENMYCQSADALDVPGGPFNTIVAGEVIEHVTNPGHFLDGARSHLAPGGRIVCTTPNPFSLLYTLRALLRWPDTNPNPEHVLWLCPGTMEVLAAHSGLMVAEVNPIEDYEPAAASGSYGLFQLFIRWTRWVLPRRLRCNSVLYVLTVPETSI